MASMLTTAMKARWQQIIQPMIEFLIKSDETHAIISNHLATAIAALIRWEKITGDQAAEKINKLLQEYYKTNHQKVGLGSTVGLTQGTKRYVHTIW